jgi:hypothetical protein
MKAKVTAKDVQLRKTKWEREHAQRVVDFHNNKYGTQISRPRRPSNRSTSNITKNMPKNCDFICRDRLSRKGIAIEVKRLTNEQVEQKYNSIYETLTVVLKRITDLKTLPGTYLLSYDMNYSKVIFFNKINKKIEFKEVISRVIPEVAKSMVLNEKKPILSLVQQQLSFQFKGLISLTLSKISDQGSLIGKGSGIIGSRSILFTETELVEFTELVSHANKQLTEAAPRKTILVIINEGFRDKDPDIVMDAFTNIKADDYSNIDQVYLVSSEEVTEIQLPNSR